MATRSRSIALAAIAPGDDASLVRQAYVAIEELIVTLGLAPGKVISENRLAGTLGLGRTPVREALQRLAREGLVTILPKRGIVVSEMDVRRQLEMLEVRRIVERYVVSTAAKRAHPEERQNFRRLAQAIEKAGQEGAGDAFLMLDLEFHQSLLASARNEFAFGAMKLMQGLARRFWFAYYEKAADLSAATHLHAMIARSIADGDDVAAVTWHERLMDNVEGFTRTVLDVR